MLQEQHLVVRAAPRGSLAARHLRGAPRPHHRAANGDDSALHEARRRRQLRGHLSVSGITVFADATESLFSASRAKEVALKDRKGQSTGKRNDGSDTPQVTPLYLVLQALSGIDDAFAEAIKDPADKDRLAKWRAARSTLVDQFLKVNGTGASATFQNPAMTKLGPTLIDLFVPSSGVTAESRSWLPTSDARGLATSSPRR